MIEQSEQGEQGTQLPFDWRTTLVGILRRSYWVLVFFVLAVPLAVLAALTMGTRVYQAETVLLYEPSGGSVSDSGESASLTTQMAMVKMRENLEETRRRLDLGSTLEAIASSIGVFVQRDTTLMTIQARWSDPEGAAVLANTIREVFQENQREIRKSQSRKDIEDLERRLKAIQVELSRADAALQVFTANAGVIDLDKEEQGFIDELTSIEMLYEQALMDKKSVELQKANISRIIEDLRTRVSEEQKSAADFDGLGELNIRVGRLRDAIRDDKELRSNVPLLAQKELELKSAKKLREEGLISEEQYAKAASEYEEQRALTVDTEQVKEWRSQIDDLQNKILPSGSGTTMSAPILRDMMLKDFEIQLQSVTADERVLHLEEARSRVKERLSRLPKLQRDYIDLSREVAARETERESSERLLAESRRDLDSNRLAFTTVSDAKVPILPVQSNRRTIFFVVSVMGILFGFFLAVASELLDTTVKSGPEMALKFSLPVLGVLPRLKGEPAIQVDRDDSQLGPSELAVVERFRSICRRIRLSLPQKGARILIVSSGHGEGRTWIATRLAAGFGRQDESVLLIDTQVRDIGHRLDLNDLLGQTDETREPDSSLLGLFGSWLMNFGNAAARFLRRVAPRRGKPWLSSSSRISSMYALGRKRIDGLIWGDTLIATGPASALKNRIGTGLNTDPGLGDFLEGRVSSFESIVKPSVLTGVDYIGDSLQPVSPDRLNSSRMSELLQSASQQYELVILDGPPALPYVDAEILARWVDAIVFVVQSRGFRASKIRQALAKMKLSGIPVTGLILNGTSRLYLRIE